MREEGFMDETTGKKEAGPKVQSEKVNPSLLQSSRFSQGRDLNEGVPAAPLAASVSAAHVNEGPPLPEGRGGHDSLQEALLIAGRASLPSGTPSAPVPPQSVPAGPHRTITEDARPPVHRKVANPKSVIEGDIVKHKESGALGTVVESSRKGMKVKLQGIGLVEVAPKDARNYKLVGRGV